MPVSVEVGRERGRLPAPLLGAVGHRLEHVVVPDRRGDRAAVDDRHARDVDERPLLLGVADPHAGGDLHGVPAEPGVDVVLGAPGLAGRRPGVDRGRRAGTALHDALQGGGHRPRHVGRVEPFLRRRVDVAVGGLPVRAVDGVQRVRPVQDPVGGERRVRVRHLEGVDLHAAERDRADLRQLRLDAEAVGHLDDISRAAGEGGHELRVDGVHGVHASRRTGRPCRPSCRRRSIGCHGTPLVMHRSSGIVIVEGPDQY